MAAMQNGKHEDLPVIWRKSAPEAEYEAARCRVFNELRPNRYPQAITKPRTLDELVASVKLATKLGTRIAIRSGGHSWACWSIRDDSLLIDLVDFKHISYNADTQIVEASPATKSCELTDFLFSRGRFTPAGHCGEVGLGGFILQGGMGLNARSYGWTCSYVKAIDVVTADGEIKHCDENENSDLYWASRGGGPGFPAIVSRFYLTTKPYHPLYKKSVYCWPVFEYEKVMKWVIDITHTLGPDVEPLLQSFCPPGSTDRLIHVQFTCFADSDEDAAAKLAPVASSVPSGTVFKDECKNTSIAEDYAKTQELCPKDSRWIPDNVYLPQDADVVSICKKAFTELPHPGATGFFEPMNPVSRQPLQDMALSLHTDFYVAVYAIYTDPTEDKWQAEWHREYVEDLQKHAVGAYLGDADFQIRPTKFWSDEAGEKLMNIRRKWDPQGRICGYLIKDDASSIEGLPNKIAGAKDVSMAVASKLA